MNSSHIPILYSFRRCPYAMRARMAIAYAFGHRQTDHIQAVADCRVELREVVLRDKPQALRDVSPKATVPVLVIDEGQRVIDESLDIMMWALATTDPEEWALPHDAHAAAVAKRLIEENDSAFKSALDRYKYADRYPKYAPESYRALGEVFLQKLENLLSVHTYLMADHVSIADIAIFPFVRQFAYVDKDWFDAAPYPGVQKWLAIFLEGRLFLSVMQKYPQWYVGDNALYFPSLPAC